MIKDNIKNADKYYYLSKNVELGLKYLQETDFTEVENGKYEISGKEVYAIVQEYNSKAKDDAKFEAHKKYIDIQYVVTGEEQIGVADIESNHFTDCAPYDEDRDIVFFNEQKPENFQFIKVLSKEFMILTPQDAHMPSISIENDKPSSVKKIVAKVSV